MAIDAVLVAFRTGIRVADVAQRVEPSNESWSLIVPGLASAEAVHRFCEQTVRILSLCFVFHLNSQLVPKSDTAPD